MTSSSALTAAKAAAIATAADLAATSQRLEAATVAHSETSAELTAVLAADAAGEAEAVAHDVAVLRSELDLRASRFAALKANHAKAAEADRKAVLTLRVETLKASSEIMSDSSVASLLEAAQVEVQTTLTKLGESLRKGLEGNLAALEEVRQLDAEGVARPNGLVIFGDIANQVFVIDGQQFFRTLSVSYLMGSVSEKAVSATKEELLAPARAARRAKEAVEVARDARYKADLRAQMERNEQRIDPAAL